MRHLRSSSLLRLEKHIMFKDKFYGLVYGFNLSKYKMVYNGNGAFVKL